LIVSGNKMNGHMKPPHMAEPDWKRSVRVSVLSTGNVRGKAFPPELRHRVADALAKGGSPEAVATRFGVSESYCRKLKNRLDPAEITADGRCLSVPQPKPRGGAKVPLKLNEGMQARLLDLAVRFPGRSQEHLAEDMNTQFPGLNISRSTVCRYMQKTAPLRQARAREDPGTTKAARAEQRAMLIAQMRKRVDPFSTMFLDETTVEMAPEPPKVYSPRGSPTPRTFTAKTGALHVLAGVMLKRPSDQLRATSSQMHFARRMEENGVYVASQRQEKSMHLIWIVSDDQQHELHRTFASRYLTVHRDRFYFDPVGEISEDSDRDQVEAFIRKNGLPEGGDDPLRIAMSYKRKLEARRQKFVQMDPNMSDADIATTLRDNGVSDKKVDGSMDLRQRLKDLITFMTCNTVAEAQSLKIPRAELGTASESSKDKSERFSSKKRFRAGIGVMVQYLRHNAELSSDFADKESANDLLSGFARLPETSQEAAVWQEAKRYAEEQAREEDSWQTLLQQLQGDPGVEVLRGDIAGECDNLRRALMRLPVVLAMDSATFHFAVKMEQPRKGEMHKLAAYLGCAGAIFMPVRNPFFNTIELVFGFVKTHLKQILSHLGEAIVDRDTLQTMLSKCFRRLRQEHLVGMLRIGCYRAGDEVQQAILGAQAADFQYVGDNLLLESATNRLQQAPTPRCALLFNRSAVRYYRCLPISVFSPDTSRVDKADEGWVAYTPGYERADADYVCASSDDANLFFVDKEPHDLLDEQAHLLQHSASQRIERLKERLEQRQPTLFVRSFYFHNARIEKLNGHEGASLRNSNDRITFIANLRETKGSYTLQMQQQQFSSFRHLAATQLARSAIVGDALSSAVDMLQPTQTFVTQAVRANGDLLQALLKWRSLRLRAVLMRSHALRVAEVLVARAGRSVNLRREGGRLRQPDPGDADWELYTASNGLEEHIREHFEDSFAVDLSNAVYHEQCNYDTHSAEADVSSVSERQLLDVMRLGAAAGALAERVLDKVEHELVVACMQRDVRSWGDPEAQLRSVSRVRIRPKLRMSALTLPGLLSFQHQQTPQKTLHWSGRYVGVEPLSQQPEELFLPSTAEPPLKLNPSTIIVNAWTYDELKESVGEDVARSLMRRNQIAVQNQAGNIAVFDGNELDPHVRRAKARAKETPRNQNNARRKKDTLQLFTVGQIKVVIYPRSEYAAIRRQDVTLYFDFEDSRPRLRAPYPTGAFAHRICAFVDGEMHGVFMKIGRKDLALHVRRIAEEARLVPVTTLLRNDRHVLIEAYPQLKDFSSYVTLHRPKRFRPLWIEDIAIVVCFDLTVPVAAGERSALTNNVEQNDAGGAVNQLRGLQNGADVFLRLDDYDYQLLAVATGSEPRFDNGPESSRRVWFNNPVLSIRDVPEHTLPGLTSYLNGRQAPFF